MEKSQISVAEDLATKTAEAAKVAEALVEKTAAAGDDRTLRIIKEYFDEGEERKRFIDVNRIPFICQDIRSIHAKIDQLARLIYVGSGIMVAVSVLLNFILK